MRVLRWRIAITAEGKVLAVLGCEAETRASGRVLLKRDAMTSRTWDAGKWLEAGALEPMPEADDE